MATTGAARPLTFCHNLFVEQESAKIVRWLLKWLKHPIIRTEHRFVWPAISRFPDTNLLSVIPYFPFFVVFH